MCKHIWSHRLRHLCIQTASGQQLDESKNINRSLLMLGRALNSFSDGSNKTHVPLRESKLTRLLSECFGGNARTWMLACVSPSGFNYSETMSTLEYAQSAKVCLACPHPYLCIFLHHPWSIRTAILKQQFRGPHPYTTTNSSPQSPFPFFSGGGVVLLA